MSEKSFDPNLSFKQHYRQEILAAIAFIMTLFLLFLFLKPVNIVSVVREGSRIYLFVEHFPMTDKAKIAWWLDNKELLKEKYNMSFIGSDKQWTVLIGEAGDGFQFLTHTAKDNDLLCFDSMKHGANCIEKKWLLLISHYNQTDTSYHTNDSKYIQRGENAAIKRVEP